MLLGTLFQISHFSPKKLLHSVGQDAIMVILDSKLSPEALNMRMLHKQSKNSLGKRYSARGGGWKKSRESFHNGKQKGTTIREK